MPPFITHLTSSFFDFYLLDWLGMSCQFLGIFLLARKRRSGFFIFSIGNAAWIGYALITGSLAQVIANLVVGTINLYGFWKWGQTAKDGKMAEG